MNAARRARINFFAANAGCATPPGRLVCAKALADAETFREWAEDHGTLTVEWVPDEDPDLSWADAETFRKLEAGVYEVLGCIVTYQAPAPGPLAGTVELTESLWGIVVEPGDNYQRVVEAELVLELTA